MASTIASLAVPAIATSATATIASVAVSAIATSATTEATSATSTKASIASFSTATTTTTSGTVNFDFLTINNGSIKFFNSSICTVVIGHGYEGIPLLSDVYIGDLTASGKFSLQDIPGTPSVHSIYKKLCHFVFFFRENTDFTNLLQEKTTRLLTPVFHKRVPH